MAQFTGDYKTFYKFVSGYARNKTLALTRPYKSGGCACCGNTNAEIQAAHKRGFERSELVRKCFDAAILESEGDNHVIDLDKFETDFIEFTSNISNFHFLCEDCHKLYDAGIISEKDFKYKQESIKEKCRNKKTC